jgi:hypothetical protein
MARIKQRTAACDEPFGRELLVEKLRVERLPSASSGLEPVESSRVEYRMTNDGITRAAQALAPRVAKSFLK